MGVLGLVVAVELCWQILVRFGPGLVVCIVQRWNGRCTQEEGVGAAAALRGLRLGKSRVCEL